ncbi:Fe-S cluster assembly protein SufD [Thalassobaculum sp. OXR-137]|uniref:Fe-S cluster assembly protein SufD n=1 Tax=Thalassobaculum sp. OXR-137 TaxID=3100173 RepID=UPI002AC90371|nr:Fe-S cluster assembly protein SufD [Thalassobaculum sp. OXR-137]WPZ32616.1 Fe-S cluster assembly protein SufD [Thalassobaculum sp. OXR-137]
MADKSTLALLTATPKTEGGSQWLTKLRRKAVENAERAGLPGVRSEAWKFTNLNALKALEPVAATGTAEIARPAAFAGLEAVELHLSNGMLTHAGDLPDGVDLVGLADPEDAPAWVSQTLGTVAEVAAHPFTAINTGAFTGGVALRIRKGATVETPILLLVDTRADGETVAAHPRLLVVAEDGAMADLVEIHTGGGAYVNNAVSEIVVGKDARLGHYKLQAEGGEAFHIAMTAVRCADSSTYDNFALSTGARLARNEIRATLAGRHIEYRINGGYLASGDQHLDTTTFIDHAEPDCASHELYKGVLAERSHGVFQGKILVRPDAQKTDGYQMNRALLLSREAEINSKPELEIYADDVKCSHGATVGELEDDQLFYLMARGIPKERARAMLVAAYVDEAIDQIQREPVREAFRTAAADWMQKHIAGAPASEGA